MATITEAALDPAERRTLDRLIELLAEEYGPELLGVWLYGSRARGERTGPYSDIDLLVITTRGEQDRDRSTELLHRAAEEAEGEPWLFSLHPYGPAELATDRAIESFFVRDVDHDKIVLFGDESAPILSKGGEDLAEGLFEGNMKPRSERFIAMAHRRLRTVGLLVENDDLDGAVEPAYYASFYAAQAALSEEDVSARRHAGVWHLFHETFVLTGRFDPQLYSAAHRSQKPREDSTYRALVVDNHHAQTVVETARHFVVAVEAMSA